MQKASNDQVRENEDLVAADTPISELLRMLLSASPMHPTRMQFQLSARF